MPGGDLYTRLEVTKRLGLQELQLCAAEVLVAVGILHECGIVYRDLKTENILIDQSGHVILTDFGLAGKLDSSERSDYFCGTPEYMAPGSVFNKK